MTRSLIIDRWFPAGIRIHRVSGTSDPRTHAAILAMLTMLVKKGRLDLIRAIADGIVHPLDVYDRYRTDKLDQLPSAETMRPLWAVADEWLAGITATHRAHSVRYSWAALRKLPQKDGASLADLPALLAVYRKRSRPQMFTNARNNVRALLRDIVGTTHPLYLAVRAIKPLERDRKSGRPFTRSTLPLFLATMREVHGAQYEAMARSLALSGMRPEEYWGEWAEVSATVVRVKTAKQRAGKVKYRRVFAVYPIVRPTVARRTFEDKMREVTRAHVCYDLRRTFMHLMEEAKIPRSRRRYYLGHSAADVSDRYEEHEVEEYLGQDRTRLKRYLAQQKTPNGPPTIGGSHGTTTGTLEVYDGNPTPRHTRANAHGAEHRIAPERETLRFYRKASPETAPSFHVEAWAA
jgi:hypothetical protein